jgi:hypothetical protein
MAAGQVKAAGEASFDIERRHAAKKTDKQETNGK